MKTFDEACRLTGLVVILTAIAAAGHQALWLILRGQWAPLW